MGKDQEIDEVVEEVVDETTNDVEVELDDKGDLSADDTVETDEDEKPAEDVPAWQLEEEEDYPDVPAVKHIGMKRKYKGRLEKKDTKIEALEQKIADLEAGKVTTTTLPPRPKSEDFDTDEEFDRAMVEWEDKRFDARMAEKQADSKKTEAVRKFKAKLAQDVDAHYDRTAELSEESGIKAENFKESDTAVREMVEAILPGQGDVVTDHMISLMGEGSEKVMYYLGRNKQAKLEFQSLLQEDKNGMKAMLFLGQQKERLTNPRKPKSSAPKPASDVKGDLTPDQTGAALKRKYLAAHKKGKVQVAYDLKKQAKKAGIDTSSWQTT